MQFDLKQAVAILAQTPQTLRPMLGELPEAWTHGGSADNWSPYDVVGHLIHGELTDWIPRARIILAQGEDPTFTPFDRLAQFEDSGSLAERLDTFARLRSENLQALDSMNLTPEKLALKGMHPELGEVDLAQLLSTWVVHDLNHLRQIVKFMADKYSGNVGPWKQYLLILQQ
ncbi:MAG: DinB family protein [Pyrinomonadaceae bacterium]